MNVPLMGSLVDFFLTISVQSFTPHVISFKEGVHSKGRLGSGGGDVSILACGSIQVVSLLNE